MLIWQDRKKILSFYFKDIQDIEDMCGNVMLVIAFSGLFSMDHVCTLENLALNKPTWQEHPLPEPNSKDFGSENAVDGLYYDRRARSGQCTINADGYYTAEWKVDLGGVVRISYINILYRTENQNPGPFVNRMAGFSLYISNTTSKDQGHLCYKDQSLGHPSVDQEIYCLIYGRYVIYYNERVDYGNPSYLSQFAYNELCEVEVYGCRGSFSDGCSYACPKNCLNRNCDAYTGYCHKCPQGYHGLYCQNECSPGYYGYNCVNQCSEHCPVPYNCDRVTGICNGGCVSGWAGDTCNECSPGYYGYKCDNQCSKHCSFPSICDRVTGKCNGGCVSGWAGDTCTECQLGYYGTNCNRCSTNCNVSGSCDRLNGQCHGGCQRGWNGSFCNQECSPGYYGYNCVNKCSERCSVPSNCDRVTGRCKGGCMSGWAGDTCNECEFGYYGKDCISRCSLNCKHTGGCDRFTGHCYGGCKPGWTGSTCDQNAFQVCNNGYFGAECNRKCGHCLQTDHCKHVNGSCLNGCLHGYKGDYCNETCPPGFFGLDCINRCDSYCSGNESCDPVLGICTEGCKRGWSGLICGLERLNRQSYGDNMPIVVGIVVSVVIIFGGSIIHVILWKRKIRATLQVPSDGPSETSRQYTELSNYDEIHSYSNHSNL